MVFYKIEARRVFEQDENKEAPTKRERKWLFSSLYQKTQSIFENSGREQIIFASAVLEEEVTFGVIAKNSQSVEELYAQYKEFLPFKVQDHTFEEITFGALYDLLTGASINGIIDNDDEILEEFGIQYLGTRNANSYGEAILELEMTAQKAKEIAGNLLFGQTFNPEIERIFASNCAQNSQGHPVHYILQTSDKENRKTIYKALLASLYAVGRIKNRRYCFVNFDDESRMYDRDLEAIYHSSQNGAVVIRYTGADSGDGKYANRGGEIIEALSEMAAKYKNKVLTVFCIPSDGDKVKAEFLNNLSSVAFIQLREGVVMGEAAKAYLQSKAVQNNVSLDDGLTSTIDQNVGYTSQELNRIFDQWYDKKLRYVLYPQYKHLLPAGETLKNQEPQGSAYQKLQQLIGLGHAKKVMDQALNYFKAQKLFADRGMVVDNPCMHMVFTGNPGTAKTTVARLFAQIMKENGLLASGDLYEVGRANLVGKYVGHTAPLVKKMFRMAKGGVLFIDEAYSLVDGKDGLYGDEAINTIVQEMENNREDTVVIFAGYPDKMEKFLDTNPGLRSRIAFHIPFEDYSADELCTIARQIALEKGLELSQDATSKLWGIFEQARTSSDFGNGRFARNVIEMAKMAQASRLLQMDLSAVSNRDIATICGQDIQSPIMCKPKAAKIGF